MLREPEIPAAKIEAVHALLAGADIGTAFQPIVDVRGGRLHAFEALARCASTHFAHPGELYAAAVRAGRVGELGRLHREQASRICAGRSLFLNIHPAELDQGWLVRPDDPIFRHRGAITLEITESVPIHYFSQCHSILAEIRAKGIQLAIDDFGAGFSNIKYIDDLHPDVVKLDRELIVGLTPESRSFRLIESIVRLCHDMGAKVTAEGIETAGELQAVIAAGVDFVQGFLLARPANPPPDFTWPHRRF